MGSLFFSLLIVGALFRTIASAEDAKEDGIKADRSRIAGHWQAVALEVNGNKVMEEDAKKIVVINGLDGTWTLFSEGNLISKGTSTIDPVKAPKAIDFTATDSGGKEDKYLGIYELDDNTRRLCFAPARRDRPTEFSSTPGSDLILVTFKRIKAEQ
jgi:uncharacterized protein (TIGR03067 family)